MRCLAIAPLVVATACSIGALDGFSGGSATNDAGPSDGGMPDAAPPGETGADIAVPPPFAAGASCAAIKTANPATPDGRYRIEPDGATPFEAHCDMTSDGGGWMLVTADMIVEEKKLSVTTERETDTRGGLVQRVFANSVGCGEGRPDNSYVAFIRDAPRWTQLRARYDYYGGASCWGILGGRYADDPFNANIDAFHPNIDVVRDMVRMGGKTADAFDGKTPRCDSDPMNFWLETAGLGRRSVVAILRRAAPVLPAGLGTFASCVVAGDGATSPTYWEYRDVYVR